MRLDNNKVAIVTGGASGLGQATTRLLVEKGCCVVIADVNEQLGTKKAKQISQESILMQLETMFVKTDVTKQQSVKNLFLRTIQRFKQLHIVVNCAGIIHAGLTLSKKGVLKTQPLQTILKINVIGTFNLCKYAAEQFSKQDLIDGERGVIINVSSVAGFQGQRGQVFYSATKGAINGMTMPLARDLGKYNIRVMTIAPGVFVTPMGDSLNQKVAEVLKNGTALGKLGVPQQFAKCVQGICQNSYATGAIWRLDGGLRLPNL